MNAIEFTTELTGADTLTIPSTAAAQLPKSGKARVIVIAQDDDDDSEWLKATYEHFLRDDSEEDAIYDTCR